jgi:hypothetical protein
MKEALKNATIPALPRWGALPRPIAYLYMLQPEPFGLKRDAGVWYA